LNQMMRLMSVKTRRRDRIQRRPGRTPARRLRDRHHHQVRAPRERAGQVASAVTVDGATLGTITYGDTL
jgi:hypothetical protein